VPEDPVPAVLPLDPPGLPVPAVALVPEDPLTPAGALEPESERPAAPDPARALPVPPVPVVFVPVVPADAARPAVPVPVAEVEVEPPAPEYPEPGGPAIEAPMSLCDGRDSEEHPAAIARVIASVSRGARGPAVIEKQSGRRVTGRVKACKHNDEGGPTQTRAVVA
jgi:hypothetical protein